MSDRVRTFCFFIVGVAVCACVRACVCGVESRRRQIGGSSQVTPLPLLLLLLLLSSVDTPHRRCSLLRENVVPARDGREINPGKMVRRAARRSAL